MQPLVQPEWMPSQLVRPFARMGHVRNQERGGMPGQNGEVYFEFVPIGRQVKVVAIDAASGIEVSIVGPSSASQRDLESVALRKLQKRITDLASEG